MTDRVAADELRAALQWYGEQAKESRLIHSGGDSARHNLQADGGERARAALAGSEPETWGEMGMRHSIERAEAVMALEAQGMTQTEAAKVLGMPLVNLNNFVKRNGLTWRVVRQGFASRDPESLSPYGVGNGPAGERMQ